MRSRRRRRRRPRRPRTSHPPVRWRCPAAASRSRGRPPVMRSQSVVTSRTATPGNATTHAWSTSLDFSPDGRWLAGVSRDRAVRIWDLAPGPQQFHVVRAWYVDDAKNLLSVRWSPDGTRLVTGDRHGTVAEWSWDAVADRWD